MALKMRLETLDGLSEEIAKLYKEENGAYVLDVEVHHENNADKDKRNLIPKPRLDREIQLRKEAEKGLQEICDQMIEDIPEDKRGIIPDLAPSAKIRWLREANKQGIFEERKAESIDSKRPGDQKPTDFDNMTPQAIMATGYKTK